MIFYIGNIQVFGSQDVFVTLLTYRRGHFPCIFARVTPSQLVEGMHDNQGCQPCHFGLLLGQLAISWASYMVTRVHVQTKELKNTLNSTWFYLFFCGMFFRRGSTFPLTFGSSSLSASGLEKWSGKGRMSIGVRDANQLVGYLCVGSCRVFFCG